MAKGRKIAEEFAQATAGLSADGLLLAAAKRFAGRVALASSFGAEDQVLVDLLARSGLLDLIGSGAIGVPAIHHPFPVAIFTLDTGRLPQESHDVLDATRKHYGIEIEVLVPERQELEAMAREHGSNLFYASVENRKLCCHVRKVAPLRRKLAQLDAWICGLRREQAATRTAIERVEWDEANGLVKLNPLADWTTDQVWAYIREHRVPYNPLHDQGFPSIGCAPCTRAVEPGQDIRAGRWWWESPEQKECGLHVVDGKLVRKKR